MTKNRASRRDHKPDPILYYVESNKKSFSLKDLKGIKPLTEAQAEVFDNWADERNSAVCLLGATGCGKSMLAIYLALSEVLNEYRPYEKLVIVRSTVQTRNMGFLPAGIEDKILPFKAPYKYLFDKLFPWTKSFDNMEKLGLVEFESTAFMRGTSLDNCIVVFDEFQDCSEQEATTIITRFGKNCRMLICGDSEQNDIGRESGFYQIVKILEKTKGVAITNFQFEDCVRSGFVKEFLRAKYRG